VHLHNPGARLVSELPIGPPVKCRNLSIELGPNFGRVSEKLDRVGVHNGRVSLLLILDLHSARSNQRDGNGDPAQDEAEYFETFVVGHHQFLCSLPNSLTRAYDDNW
jgi:hypothetical protein